MLSPCRNWSGPSNKGRGIVQIEGQRWIVYRWLWEQIHGPIPKGFHLHHKCENRRCVNIEHLECLSSSDHAAIHTTVPDPPRQFVPFPKTNPKGRPSKLNDDQKTQVAFELCKPLNERPTYLELARRYEVTVSTIANIWRRYRNLVGEVEDD